MSSRALAFRLPFAAAPALAAALAATTAAPARAQVIAHPNQVTGVVRFTNTDPAVLAYLNAATDLPAGLGEGLRSAGISAYSLPPQSPQLIHSTSAAATSALAMPYEITVEAGEAGSGIDYQIFVTASLGASGRYEFAGASSGPVEREPAPDRVLDFAECAGVVRLHLVDSAQLPFAPSGGSVSAYPESPVGSGLFPDQQSSRPMKAGLSEQRIVVRGDGGLYRIVIRVRVGTDPYVDMLTFETETFLRVPCDAVLDHIVEIGGPETLLLGGITGRLDVERESEIPDTGLNGWNGPWGNYRYARITTDPASGPFELINVLPSDYVSPPDPYGLGATVHFRTGSRAETLTLPTLPVLVPRDAVIDVGDAFLVDPGYVSGDLLLLGPAVSDPAIGAGLEDLTASSYLGSSGSFTLAPGARVSASGAGAKVAFAGGYDPIAGAWLGDYEMVLGGLYREPSLWRAPWLNLILRDVATPAVPESFRDSGLRITRSHPDLLLTGSSREILPQHYCFSEVRLHIRSDGGTFRDPQVSIAGSFNGVDFEGRVASYTVASSGPARGTPLGPAFAPEGLVAMTLPEGRHTLTATIEAQNTGSGTSSVRLLPIQITIGCGEEHDIWADLQLTVDPVPRCLATPLASFSGRIVSAESIDRIEHVVNGGAPVVDCTACGVSPTFAFSETLAPGVNEVQVSAIDALGHVASVRLYPRLDLAPPPADYGNTLLAVERGPDVELHWTLGAGAVSTQLRRDVSKRFSLPVVVAEALAPGVQLTDPGAMVPTPARLYYYRVRGKNCAGEPGL